MPDGTIVTGVPDGITQTELLARYSKYTPAQPVETERPSFGAPMGEDFGSSIMAAPKPPKPVPTESLVQPNNSINAQDYLAAVAARKEENPDRTISGTAIDAGVTFLKSAIGLPEAFLGLADIPTAGYIGKFLEQNGYKPKEAKAILDTYLSEAQQAANRKVKEAQGFGPTLLAGLQNPSVILSSAAESLPQMVGGAGVARGLMKAAPSVAPWLAGAIGEGVLGAGSAAEQMRQESKTGLLTPKQSLSALGSGAGTAAFGAVGGRLANKLGLDDVETMLASGVSQGKSKSVLDFAKRAGASGISEGVFEEMPQSAQETMWMNYAMDKPIMEGVAEASAMGLLTGAAMGVAGTGAGQLLNRRQQETGPSAEQMMRDRGFLVPEQKPSVAPVAPVAPTAERIEPTFQPESLAAATEPTPAKQPAPTFEDQVQELIKTATSTPANVPQEEQSMDMDAMLAELEGILGTKPAEEPIQAPEVKPAAAQAPADEVAEQPAFWQGTPVKVLGKPFEEKGVSYVRVKFPNAAGTFTGEGSTEDFVPAAEVTNQAVAPEVKPTPPAKPPAAPAIETKGPSSRAPDVLDLKKYTPAEVKAEWERSGEGRRRSNLARLENPAIEQNLLGKSWDAMTAEEHKLVRSAYDEDFFSPQWYIN
jgi:hypothetical protein